MTSIRAASPLSYAIQDYLKGIYELTEDGSLAATSAIAARLRHSPASVTGMLRKLASLKPALVTYQKHRGARLTADGRRAALEVIRHHRLLETWLVQSLGYSWDEVHGEAERLEHVMSEDLEARISQALGDPQRDPHGEPIPSAHLTMPADSSVALAEMKVGQEAIVRRVRASDELALRQLAELGVTIGSRIRVVEMSNYDKLIRLRIRGRSKITTMGPALSERVYVERTDKSHERN
jgi:DtxR family Mn-dependent transcriptional regulator